MAHSGVLGTQRWRDLCAKLKRELPPVCWYCGEPINRALPGNHPSGRGWTLDHKIPRAEAPHLTFVESNLAPAHRDCNSKRAGRMNTVAYSEDWG